MAKEEKSLTKTDKSLVKKEETEVSKALKQQENVVGQQFAMKALNLVKPMIKSVSDELSNMLGDNEKIIIIRKTKSGSPTSILILDTAEDFIIQGKKGNNGKFLFTGEPIPGTKRPKAIKNFYVAEEFVDMLLTGRMQDMTEKLMK